jgi:TonB-linked SusC/RagA family outer membrane protein
MQRWTLLVAALVCAAPSVRAQAPTTGRITGIVTVSPGAQPLNGANLIVVGTQVSGSTGPDGRFSLPNVPVGTRQVRAQRIGYAPIVQTVTVTAGETATANFTMSAQAVQLSGVVTVGYGTQSRREVTGAVSSIQSEDIRQVVSANPLDAIKGRIPGVDITASSFEPGAASSIRIRGTRSITAGNNPLYVVDGVPITGDLRDFDQNSIERIEVLKDASAAAVYGSRGANGVVMITTKRGQAGRTEFTLSSTYGTSSILNKVNMMNGEQFANYRRESYRSAGTAACANYMTNPTACDQVALDARMRANLAAGVSTDWQDELLRQGSLQNHQLGVSGGNESTRFRAGLGYLGQTGIAITQGYNAKTGSFNLSHDYKRLNLQLGVQAANTVRDAGRGAGIWDEALFNSPLGRAYDSTGAPVFLPTEDGLRVNPIVDAKNNIRQVERTNLLGTLTGSLEIAPGLRAHVNFGPQYSNYNDGYFVGVQTRQKRGAGAPDAGSTDRTQMNYTLSNFLDLDKQYGENHHLQATLLYEFQRQRQTFDSAAAQNLPYPQQLWYSLGTGQNYALRGNLTESSLQSGMARVNYTLFDRYTLTATGRLDGSSVLAEGHKYAFFPAASIGWQLGDESFMQGVPGLSDMKLRVSYGRVGNSAIGAYQTLGQLNQAWYTFGASSPTVLGYQPGAIPNPDLRWETTDKYNVGLDFGFLSQRISGAIDVYRENTHDLLLSRALPYTSGFASVLQNVGATKNSGVEVSLSTENLVGWRGFDWGTDFNISANRNEIVQLASGLSADVGSGRWVGQPINVYYDYQFQGIWQAEEAAAATAMCGCRPGDVKVADLNGDGRLSAEDRTFIGRHFNFPRWQGSLNNRVRFKALDLSVLATARMGYTVNSGFTIAYTNLSGRFNNVNVNYWTPERPSNEEPRPSTNGIGNYANSRALVDASHVRIRDITLGFRLPASLASRVGTQNARLYVRAQDPFVFTKFKGWDPEAGFNIGDGNSTASQIDVGGPAYRTFLFGFDLGF